MELANDPGMIEAGYEACIFGELVFPSGTLTAWRGLDLDPDAFDDWPESFRVEEREPEARVTIGRWLDDCARYERSGARHFLELDVWSDDLQVRGFLEQEAFDADRRPLVTMFRLANRCGGRGSLTLVSKPWQRFVLGYRIEVGAPDARLHSIAEDEIKDLPDHAALEEIVARVKASPSERAVSTTRVSLPRL